EWTPPRVILLNGINVTFATLPSRSAEDHSLGAGRGDRARPGSPGNASSGAGAPARVRPAADLARARRAPSAATAGRSGAEPRARATWAGTRPSSSSAASRAALRAEVTRTGSR